MIVGCWWLQLSLPDTKHQRSHIEKQLYWESFNQSLQSAMRSKSIGNQLHEFWCSKNFLFYLKLMRFFFFLLGFAIKVFVSGLNEFDRIKLTPVKDTSASFATFSKWLIAFLQHFSPEKHVSLASCSEYWNSENFLSRSYNKGRIWMYPLYVFNRFLHVRYIHAYAYATCNNVNEISLITKKYSRYYFKVMPLFAAVTDSFFKKDLQKEQRPGKQQESKAGNIRELAAGERVIRITIVRIFDYCCYFGLYPTCWL